MEWAEDNVEISLQVVIKGIFLRLPRIWSRVILCRHIGRVVNYEDPWRHRRLPATRVEGQRERRQWRIAYDGGGSSDSANDPAIATTPFCDGLGLVPLGNLV